MSETQSWVSRDLEQISELARNFPGQNMDSPQLVGWEEFFVRNPHRLDMTSPTAYSLAKGGRELIDESDVAQAFVAGAIIRRHLYDDQITRYGLGN